MKRLAIFSFLLACLVAAYAFAQTLTPNNLNQVEMPPQSVLGNTLPTPGPLNAVPFLQLGPLISQQAGVVTRQGTVGVGNCAKWTSPNQIGDAGVVCGGGGGGGGGVTTFNGRSGAVVPQTGDYAFPNISGTVAPAQIPFPSASTLGGIESVTCAGSQFLNSISTSGVPGCSTPAGGGNVSTSGTITTGNCAQFNGSTTVISTGAPCGSGGGSGTNLGYVSITDQLTGPGGDGTCHALSTQFGSLAAARAVYPFVDDLSGCIDWAAAQKAINTAYAVGGNASETIYCKRGNYVLSNPLFVDQANNIQGSYAAWASGTTYGNGANVTYNGIPWKSFGSGNVGNPPTSMNFYPAQLQTVSNDTFPIQTVTISNGSPAVLVAKNEGVANPGGIPNGTPLVLMTQQFAVPPAGATPALPTGLNLNQVYYVVGNTGAQFNLAATPGGAAINTSSAGVGVFFLNSQVWIVDPVINSTGFSGRVSFVGDDNQPNSTGCQFTTANGMWTNGAIYLGPQSGNIIKNINVTHQTGGGVPTYRCNRFRMFPQGVGGFSYYAQHAGWVQMDNGGGSSRTKYENLGASGFYTDHAVGYANGALADSNTWEKSTFTDACIGVEFMETQAFINSMYDNSIQAGTAIKGDLSEGVLVKGGNYSSTTSLANSFTISSVSLGGSSTLTATVSSPDQYLQAPMCAMNAGYKFYVLGSHYGNDTPFGSACGYNAFVIVTPHYGAIPFYIGAFNPNTNVITLVLVPQWNNSYFGGLSLPSEITSATTLYAAEAVTVFSGQIQAENIHVENPSAPTQLVCNCGGFGAARVPSLKDVLLNSDMPFTNVVCCNFPAGLGGLPGSSLARFYAAQLYPFVNAYGGDVIIDGLVGGVDALRSTRYDRMPIALGTGTYVEARHMGGALALLGPTQVPPMQFQTDYQGLYNTVGGLANKQLSGGYWAMGAQALGGGLWDGAYEFLPGSFINSTDSNGSYSDMPSFWRAIGWGAGPQWGIRPAPWAKSCILPSQATTLAGALPSITYTAQLSQYLNITAGGTGYAVNDVLTLVGGTGSPVGQVTVQAVSSGAVTAAKVSTTGSYSGTLPTSFTVTGGSGSGATFNQPVWVLSYQIPYPMLWGGKIYDACDYKDADFGAHGGLTNAQGIKSKNFGYSYFQNLTTTNVPNLQWSMLPGSPFVYMNQELLELMFPGLVFSITGSGGCSGTDTLMITEVHPTIGSTITGGASATAGYVKVVNAAQDGTPYVPSGVSGGGGAFCTGTTLGQAGPNLAYPY